ncbi:uncharacterized protein LOC121362048 [Pyrgilauda ruficollis]|uniref:uncharacterized protein LOC121362048 n=1 Tax=Pyrgilauda ruficollis TaxID=221976 RepID=UPI001B86C212|nr:uncharacterized protein LOC121362048 [Pyrgilauda ruficollis]
MNPHRDCHISAGSAHQEATSATESLTPPLSSPQLSPALLQPQVTVVAALRELLATEPRWNMILLPDSADILNRDLEDFSRELRATIKCIDDTWWPDIVTSGDGDPVTSLSQALAAYKGTPWTAWDRVKMEAIMWQGLVDVLMERWVELSGKATKLRNTWWEVVSEAADMAINITSLANYRQDKAARDGTAQKKMVELGQALGREEGTEVVAGHEVWVRIEPRVAASEVTKPTKLRQLVKVTLGPLEHLMAACDEATAFPRELQRLLEDIEAALEGTNEASRDVPEDLVAKVTMAKRLWEANARLAKDHLVGAVDDIVTIYFHDGPASPSGIGVTERCQRAIEDIPRLLRLPEHPQSVPKVSPVSVEPQEVSPPQLQALVAVVATLGKVVATVTGPHRGKFLRESPDSLHEDLKNFTQNLCKILDHGDVTSLDHRRVTSLGHRRVTFLGYRRVTSVGQRGVTSLGHHSVPSLGQALATLGVTLGTTRASVRAVASAWRESVAKLVDSCDQLAREATKLRDACGKVVMDQQLMVALDKKEVAREMATHDAHVAAATNEAMGEAVGATRWAMVATKREHWAEMALGLLQCLVAACDRATLFNWNMEWRLKDIEAILKGTNELSPDVLQALVAKVAEFEWLWVASTRLAKDHLLGALGVIDNILSSPCGDHGGPIGPGSRMVAKRCQKAIKDIPRLLLWWCL